MRIFGNKSKVIILKQIKYSLPLGMFVGKHYCPACEGVLIPKKHEKTVNSKSSDAKDFDFNTDAGDFGGRLVGDVTFTWYMYWCQHCECEFTNAAIRSHERKKPGKMDSRKAKKIEMFIFLIISLVLLIGLSCLAKRCGHKNERYDINSDQVVQISGVVITDSASLVYIYIKKHHCPICDLIMTVRRKSTIINTDSPDAKYYNFYNDSNYSGYIEYRTSIFYCQNCENEMTVEDMKRLEAENK